MEEEEDISSSSDVNIMFESEAHTEPELDLDSGSERGSPSLVGRGIANPMSERTRGFELPRKRWDEIPTPRAIFPRNLISNLTPYQAGLRETGNKMKIFPVN